MVSSRSFVRHAPRLTPPTSRRGSLLVGRMRHNSSGSSKHHAVVSLAGIIMGLTALLYGVGFVWLRRRHSVTAVATMTNLFLLQDLNLRKAWIQDGGVLTAADCPPSAQEQQQQQASAGTSLTLADLIITEYLASGAVNDVCLVRFREPTLARAYGVDVNQTLALKLVYNRRFGHNEITSFERFNQVDENTAQRLHLVRPLWMQRNVTNPYYCSYAESTWKNDDDDGYDDDETQQEETPTPDRPWNDYADCVRGQGSLALPNDFDNETVERFRALRTVDVLLMPVLKEVYLHKTAKTMRDIKMFFYSMLQVLEVAHAHNVNNIDVQLNRNMYVNTTTGRAILFDWNALIEVGDKAYDEEQNDVYASPETWLEEYWGIEARTTNIHAMDVWQAGIAWSSLIYSPCVWQSASALQANNNKKWLKKIISALGGNTIIPVNATVAVDLATLAGLPTNMDRPRVTPRDFQPLLGTKIGGGACKKPSWFMDNPKIPQADKDLAIDFLLRMLVLSPMERPTATELLQHPIWDDVKAWEEEEEEERQ